MLVYAFTFSAALLLSIFITPLIRKMAIHLRAVDDPGYRKVHTVQIPRLGGIAVFISFMVVFYSTLWLEVGKLKQVSFSPDFLIAFAVAAFLIIILGVLDDVWTLRPLSKLVLQVLAAGIVMWQGLLIRVIEIPFVGDFDLGPLAIPLTLLWIVGITNAINLIDGLDGLAAGVTFIASLTLFLISLSMGSHEMALFSVVLAGSVMGFLRYNFNPAQIFLGDSGSLFLGFTLANFSLVGTMKSSTAVALLIPIIALGFPIMDTMLAMIRRGGRAMKQGKGIIYSIKEIGRPDREHVHHKLMDLGYTHRRTVVLLYGLCLIFGLFAFIMTAFRDEVAATILFFVALLVFVMVRVLGYLEFRGLKEGNFLEEFMRRVTGGLKGRPSDVNPKSKKDDE